MEMCSTAALLCDDNYRQYEHKYGFGHNRKCIDGKETGCGNCVGFCRFTGHPGFLTEKMRTSHKCIDKSCNYYLGKPARIREKRCNPSFQNEILSAIQKQTADMEGIKILSAENCGSNRWQFDYVTITNEYSLKAIQEMIEEKFNCIVSFKKLEYSFDVCTRLIMVDYNI